MNMNDLIYKKRKGEEHTAEEIYWIINNYTNNIIPDYQISSWLMAICFQGMSFDETFYLTDAIVQSGDTVDLSSIAGVKVDKHSTGGVGDKATLVIAPLAASLGLKVAKMSGRGLGHTGGTIDKLESIPGFDIAIDEESFLRQVSEVGAAIVGQTGNLTPADKKLYALRDVTATVDSIPLIAASIMSKKIAAGADVICLDVKVGSGAFMKTLPDAKVLAQTMVEIGKRAHRHVIVFLTDMDQPLGYHIGNSLEVIEAIETLSGNGPSDLTDVCATIVGYMLYYSKKAATIEAGIALASEQLKLGNAVPYLTELIKSQHGDANVVHDFSIFPQAKFTYNVTAQSSGAVQKIDAYALGHLGMDLGAGRKTKDDVIDYGVGLSVDIKVGQRVSVGDVIGKIYAQTEDDAYVKAFQKAVQISEKEKEGIPLIFEIID